ncbi:cardiolipin synthase [Aquimarina intermedia]|uniref:Cardiolipin synthase n=1 Tax=Aquimarina intermedia TaxID=350814 RepID=A0A5S5C497_9FLAO|nr:cardiolipin synthase [Aquimarina intermedia]TYP74241.1 cardiolipin synthase [Aquimarina intermedia]
MIYDILIAVYILIASLIVIQLILNGLRPAKTLAWMLAIFTIPVGGILLYFILGRNRRKNKLIHYKHTDKIKAFVEKSVQHCQPVSLFEYEEHKKLIQLIINTTSFLPITGNAFRYLKNGKITFEAIFEALRSAKSFIHIQYYIFEDGELADIFIEIFKIKVKEGVQIRILYDAIGSLSLSKKYIKQLKDIGVEVYSFLPVRFGRFLASINYRNHRKIIVVDNKIAFTGGINLSDKYIKNVSLLGIWHDIHLELKGPIVNNIHAIFATDWSFVSEKDDILHPSYFSPTLPVGKATGQIVYSGPDSEQSATQQLYFSMITEASSYVYIANPYIIPGEAILDALKVAALSGVDVRLLLSDKSDSRLVRWCVRSYFEELLVAKVKIYLYPDNFLHSKIIVADDTVASIGTTNMDIRSFEQNYEVNALIYDDDFAISLKDDFLRDCKKSAIIDYSEFEKRSNKEKMLEGIAKMFSPVL